jgi:hypothetical protein
MWRKIRRKDYSDEEEEEEHEEAEDDEEEEEDKGEEDHEPVPNAEDKGKLPPPLIHVAVVGVVPSPNGMKRNSRISTGGRVPRNCLSSTNLVINLHRRENTRVPAKDLPGEWDHIFPQKRSEDQPLSGSIGRKR